MPSQIGYFDTLKSVAGKVFAYLASITLAGTDGKTITVTQNTSLDEAVAMSSKAPKASPIFSGDVTITSGTIISSGLPNAIYNLDTSGNGQSLINNATVNISNFSGIVIVNNWSTGAITMYMCGAGGTSVVFAHGVQVGTLTYSAGISGYIWTNTSGDTSTFSFVLIRTRPNA